MTHRSGARARGLVLEALRRAGAFRSAQALHLELAAAGQRVSLATVYRNLQALALEGQVDQVDGAETLYRVCGEEGHHHHVVCRACGASAVADGPDFEAWAEQVARAAGFTQVRHSLEITGLCPACRVGPA